jgi:hypothetical protein
LIVKHNFISRRLKAMLTIGLVTYYENYVFVEKTKVNSKINEASGINQKPFIQHRKSSLSIKI